MYEHPILKEEIEQAINREPRISGPIQVEVNNRHVRLSGFVFSFLEKEIAENIARQFGPIQLENDITVESPKVIEDEEIFELAQQAIEKNPDLAHEIGVDRVVDGVIYLKGNTSNAEKIEQAANLVATVPGTKDVVSEVRIKTDVLIVDSDLVSGVKQALKVEPSIHEEFIDVIAKNGIVYLSGTVDDLRQKQLASRIAEQLPGVVKVINNIELTSIPSSLDKAIENEVLKALEMSEIDMRNVNVNVLDGVVFLDGMVGSIKQRDNARKIAEAVPGVRYVQNDLVVGFHIEPKAS